MRVNQSWLPLLLGAFAFLTTIEARRIRVRPTSDEDDDNIHYYSAIEPDSEEESDQNQRVVLISSDQYNGFFGQPTSPPARVSQTREPYQTQRTAAVKVQHRPKEHHGPKQPPVQTIRNYNKVNDDGSFTFGYEAADGSFKEETRGVDCVVRGKYGYIDPDGNKREFTYVSGNPCDPNAPKDDQEEEEKDKDDDEPENVPANYPTRPIKPYRPPPPPPPKPVVPLFESKFESSFESEEDEQPEPEQVLRPTVTNFQRQPSYPPQPQYIQKEEPKIYRQPPPIPSTTPASIIYKQTISPLTVTPRPRPTQPPLKYENPATTYRPQLLQVAVTPAPPILYTKQISVTPRPHFLPSSTASPVLISSPRPSFDLEDELNKFQQPNNYVAPNNAKAEKVAPKPINTPNQVYSTELVYDPSSGEYKTQLYQTLPQTQGDFRIAQSLQPYVQQPRPQLVNLSQLQAQYRPRPESPSQALYKQQQADLQFQNSAQLYAQQQRARVQQAQPTTPQQYYYVQPRSQQQQLQQQHLQQQQLQHQPQYTNAQIDQFLRGHNIQF